MSVSTFLGWFAILEVLVLKSRGSRSPGLLRFSRGALGSGFPIQLSPFRGWHFGSSDHRVGLAELLRTSRVVLRFLCMLPSWPWPGRGVVWVFHVWVFSGSPSGCECSVLCFRHGDVVLQNLPCSSVGGLHCPGPVNARIIAWEIVFKRWVRSGFSWPAWGAASFDSARRSCLSQVIP